MHARAAIAIAPDDPIAPYAMAEIREAAGGAPLDERRTRTRAQSAIRAGASLPGHPAWRSGETQGAIEAFERVLRLDPAHARSWNNLGNAQRTLGRLQEAEHSFAKAIAARPDYPLASANLAEVLRDQGEVERAEDTLRQALARSTGQAPYRPLLVLLAGLLRERGELDESAQFYTLAIQAAPEQSGGEWFNLGSVLGERGEPDRAREAYTRAYATNPKDLRGLIAEHLGLPMIYADAAALDAARTGFGTGLVALGQEFDSALEGLSGRRFSMACAGRISSCLSGWR